MARLCLLEPLEFYLVYLDAITSYLLLFRVIDESGSNSCMLAEINASDSKCNCAQPLTSMVLGTIYMPGAKRSSARLRIEAIPWTLGLSACFFLIFAIHCF